MHTQCVIGEGLGTRIVCGGPPLILGVTLVDEVSDFMAWFGSGVYGQLACSTVSYKADTVFSIRYALIKFCGRTL